jgi:hypothetical protein
MLRSTASHLLLLGCYYLCAVTSILSSPDPQISCFAAPVDHLFPSPSEVIGDCYKALNLLEENLVHPRAGLLRNRHDPETGRPFQKAKALDQIRFMNLPVALSFGRCLIDVDTSNSTNASREMAPSAQFGSSRYFYLWERVNTIVKQVLQYCFYEQNRIGSGSSRIEEDEWSFHFEIRVYRTHREVKSGDALASAFWRKLDTFTPAGQVNEAFNQPFLLTG